MNARHLVAYLGLFLAPAALAATPQVGDIPVPVVLNVTVRTAITNGVDEFGGTTYIYNYTVTNPASNTGYLWNIQIDVSAPNNYQYNIPGDLRIPRGNLGDVAMYILLNETTPKDGSLHDNVVPFGIDVPDDWVGSLTINQTGGFFASTGDKAIAPGQTLAGLVMYTEAVPTIRTMTLRPDWMLSMSTREPTPAEQDLARQIEQSLLVKVNVLGPSYTSGNNYDHWNQFRSDISRAMTLGWITDASFGNTMLSDLQTARAAMDQNGAATALPALNVMLVAIQGSNTGQRNEEAHDLLLANVQDLINSIPPDDEPAPPPPQPKATFIQPTTPVITAAVGSTVTVVEQVVDQARNDAPMAGFNSPMTIEGPDDFQTPDPDSSVTDSNGHITLTITGTQAGVDKVTLPFNGNEEERGTPLTQDIVWNGGPDLKVTHFGPPIVNLNGQPFAISDTTKNVGNTAIGPSQTYYLAASDFPVQDQSTVFILDWRDVPALQPGQENSGSLTVDVGGTGTFYILACANWDHSVIETNYANNCADGQLVATVVRDPNAQQPPVCTAAVPSQTLLWPPDHKSVNITINGVTDPNNLVPTITITGIQQDEPVNAKGDGNTAPDGAGVGTSVAQVRSERSGTAVGGRLYFISFSASDAGGSCSGTVAVGVPHDQGQHNMPTDNGLRYDSTASH